MRAFFQMQEALLIVSNTQLQLEQIRAEIKQLRTDMNDTLADQNDINVTRCQARCDNNTKYHRHLPKSQRIPNKSAYHS